mgnify:CR=1 FL=1
MKISVKVDYACRVMAELARLHGSGGLAQIEHLQDVLRGDVADGCLGALRQRAFALFVDTLLHLRKLNDALVL